MNQENEQALATTLEAINEKINILIKEQQELKKEFKQKNTEIMQEISKLQEYNDIDEMRIELIDNHINKIARMVLEIEKKLY